MVSSDFLSVCFMITAIVFSFHVITPKGGRDCQCYTVPKFKFHQFHVFFFYSKKNKNRRKFSRVIK